MKHISLFAVVVAGLSTPALLATEPKLYDLDGRKVVVWVYRDNNFRGTYKQMSATVKGRTIKLDLADPNESTSFKITAQDQADPVLKQYLQGNSRGWAYTRLGLEYFFPFSQVEFAGRQVSFRIYADGADVSRYSTATVDLSDRKVKCEFGKLDYPAFLVVFGQDQQDPLIKHILGNSIHGQVYKTGMELRLPWRPLDRQDEYRWEFYDAMANALPGGQVQVYFRSRYRTFKLGTFELDTNGQITLPFRVAGNNCKIGAGFYPSTYCRFRFVVSTDQHNTCIIEPGGCMKSGAVYLSSVLPGSEADSRSVWANVVDPNGKPVSGALVKGLGLIPPGAKWVSDVDSQRHCVVTDKQGKFRMYLPIAEEAYQVGTLIPPKTEYSIDIEPPKGSNLAPFKGRILNGRHNKIILEYAGYFRTFVFEDEKGPIKDPKLLRDIEMVIERSGQRNLWFRYEQLKDGATLPLGTYRNKVYSPHTYIEFQPLTVTAQSPEQLIFRVSPAKSYYGRVVNGITGEPMAEANVSISSRSSALTNESGRFEIAASSGERVPKIIISKENYLTVKVLKSWTKQDEDGKYEAPDVKLFPAATVTLEPVAKELPERGVPQFRPQWFVVDKDNPYWVSDLLAACGKHPDDGIYRDFKVEANKHNSFQVPAGVGLRIHLRVLGDIEWAPVTIADYVRLKPGQVYNAGRHIIGDPFAVFVEVLDSAGKPIEGVPVIVCGDHDPAVSSSDENGIALFEFVGYSKGEFIVEYDPGDVPNAPRLRQAILYDVAGPQDANSVYTLQVSDEMLQHLFK